MNCSACGRFLKENDSSYLTIEGSMYFKNKLLFKSGQVCLSCILRSLSDIQCNLIKDASIVNKDKLIEQLEDCYRQNEEQALQTLIHEGDVYQNKNNKLLIKVLNIVESQYSRKPEYLVEFNNGKRAVMSSTYFAGKDMIFIMNDK